MENNKSICASCPREAIHKEKLESLDVVRKIMLEGAERIMDDSLVSEFADAINSIGLTRVDTDPQSIRELATNSLDRLDDVEKEEINRRKEETQFCVGALHLRAKDSHTEYNVTLCRSPKNASSNDTEIAKVKRTSRTN